MSHTRGCSPCLWQMKGQGSCCLGKGLCHACAALRGASQLGRAPGRRGTSFLIPMAGTALRQQAETVEILQGFMCSPLFACKPFSVNGRGLGSWSSPEVCANSLRLSTRRDLPCQHRSPESLWDYTGDNKGHLNGPYPLQDLSSHLVLPHPVAKLPEQEKG